MHPDLIILMARADLDERLRASARLGLRSAARRARRSGAAGLPAANVVSLRTRRLGPQRRRTRARAAS